ncbi:SRPBCC family protein [Streptomyces sp. LHD-70]|uniref:SRPBCC family protein n=1 Tax=Streptomyces sp. LHD-70 TaxID=3072140 RepID=UPI00280FFEC8|nr:SRPBCC family protein [Streptomyces sp. LHD-70]MDQ8705991.1 SRPBCC family protein [Streptomyces sp. LHD-70]
MRISETMTVGAPIETVYGVYADLDGWCDVLPDVVGVDVHYMDGYNQEFSMTVERPGGNETVRGVRYCRAPYELELVQTTPPPGLSRMTGLWTFTERDGRTTVTAARDFRLLDENTPAGAEEAFAEKLHGFLKINLDLFRKAAEEKGARA